MPHPNSHSGQIVSIKNIAKGAINIRGEAIAFFHLPPESLSSQEAESLDQPSKEVPRGKMGRFVEAINSKQKRDTLNPRRNYPSLTRYEKLNTSINTGRYLGRLKYSQTSQSQRTTQLILSHSNSYSLIQVQTMTSHQKWGKTRRNTGHRKLR